MSLIVVLLSLVLAAYGAPTTDIDGRIVGGNTTTIEEYPFQVSLLYRGYASCGGSIVAPTYVITAAHCTDGVLSEMLTVRAGSNYSEDQGQLLGVVEFYQHPQFTLETLDFDISILALDAPIKYGPAAAPIGLAPEGFKVAPGTKVIVTGWGTLTENGDVPKDLQVVEVPAISNEDCQESYDGMANITERMICAREDDGGKDSCQGDSGGPLVVDGVLVGIVSWGVGCARANYPGVYSRVSELRGYIKSVINI